MEYSSSQALHELVAGNWRFTAGASVHPHQSADHRTTLCQGQKPFAIILCCSDSRVAPEVLFDQGLGDIFVVRVAGNVLDDLVLGSIEYAVEHLSCPLVMVLGHSQCGAVTAALQGGHAPGHISHLLEALQPAVHSIGAAQGDRVDLAVRANVILNAAQLKACTPILHEFVRAGRLQIVGAYYDLTTGKVDLLE